MEKMYICPVCGKNYNSIAALNDCISQHAEEEKNEQLAAEEAKQEILSKFDELKTLIDKFNEEFGDCGDFNISFRFSKEEPATNKKETASNQSKKSNTVVKSLSDKREDLINTFKELSTKLGDMDDTTKKLYDAALNELENKTFTPEESDELKELMNSISMAYDILGDLK